MPIEHKRLVRLRRTVRYFYDLQKLRIATGNRGETEAVQLEPDDLVFLKSESDGLKSREAAVQRELGKLLRGVDIWEEWLTLQPGIGPTLGGLLVSSFDISRCTTVSKMWRFAGLAVIDGQAERRHKGVRAKFNPWLKSKLVYVMPASLLKASPLWKRPKDPLTDKPTTDQSLWIPLEPTQWGAFYYNYKHRKETTILEVCMGCAGTGVWKPSKKELERQTREAARLGKPVATPGKCHNCGGNGGPASWGRSGAHRHQAACRYMAKMLLLEFWKVWREMEGLEVREPYAVEYQGREHHE